MSATGILERKSFLGFNVSTNFRRDSVGIFLGVISCILTKNGCVPFHRLIGKAGIFARFRTAPPAHPRRGSCRVILPGAHLLHDVEHVQRSKRHARFARFAPDVPAARPRLLSNVSNVTNVFNVNKCRPRPAVLCSCHPSACTRSRGNGGYKTTRATIEGA